MHTDDLRAAMCYGEAMLVREVVPILALFLSISLLVVGNAMLGTLLAVRMQLEGYRAGMAGIVLACYSVGFVAGSMWGIRVVRRVGHIRAFATFGAATTAAILVHPLHMSVPTWMLLRLVVGYCIAGLLLVTESWINARATVVTRGALLATYMVLFFLASAGGQLLLAAGDPAVHHLFVVAAILVSISLIPLSLTRTPAPELSEGERLGMRDLYRLQALGLYAAFLSGVVASAFGAVGPVYAMRMGLEIHQVSLFMGTAVLASMLFQWPVGLLSDYVPRGYLILGIACVGVALSLLTAWLGGTSQATLFLCVALFVGSTSSLYAVSLALTHDALDHTQIVPASATLLLSFGLGTVLGPVGGAWSITLLGPAGLFYFTSGALVVLTVLAVPSLVRQPPPPLVEQTHCVGVAPVSTPVLLEIDPRNEDFQPLETADEAGELEQAGVESASSPPGGL
jgi:MFS family permease